MSDTAVIPETLSYAGRTDPRPRVALYRIAFWCGLVPLAVGVLDLLLYTMTSAPALVWFGFWWLGIGLVCFFVGVVCLTVWTATPRPCSPEIRAQWRKRTRTAGMVLASNIPAAIVCAAVGLALANRYAVIIVNDSHHVLDNVQLHTNGQDIYVGRIEPGQRVRKRIKIEGDGELTFTATKNGMPVSGVVDGYVTPDPVQSRATLNFTDSGHTVNISR